MDLYCLACIGESLESTNGNEPVIEKAITLAPSWQMTNVGGQMMMACVALPTCKRHLNAQPVSAEEQAIRGGIIIPGRTA